jgi:hypothetical protein
MFTERDTVVLTDSVKGDDGTSFLPGDVGCVIHVHSNGRAYVVEFAALDGETIDIATVTQQQVRAVTARDITHAREATPAR